LSDNKRTEIRKEEDKTAATRKEDHIDLAFKSSTSDLASDKRFYYEPVMEPHADQHGKMPRMLADKAMDFPIMVSSMTGGTERAKVINHNLARAVGEFRLAMGLGSCRQLLYEDRRMHEFDVRPHMGDQPLLINLGIAQIEELLDCGETDRVEDLRKRLDADGLIIHVNPLQEWMQPEGDRLKRSGLEIISAFLKDATYPVIVKEVGQGFGRSSIEALLKLPLEALDLAGYGGTNFSKLELLRSDSVRFESFKDVFRIGHDCQDMLEMIMDYFEEHANDINCRKLVFSGGVRSFLDGYYFIKKSPLPAIYAQASAFLKYAEDYEQLKRFLTLQTEGLKMAQSFLRIRD